MSATAVSGHSDTRSHLRRQVPRLRSDIPPMVDDGERGELTRDGGGPMLPPFFRDSEKQEIGPTTMSGTSRTLRSSNRHAFLRTLLRGTPMARSDYKNCYDMTRESIIEIITDVSGDDPIISITGKTSRELFEIRANAGVGHGRDFLTVNSMGHSSSIAATFQILSE